MLDRVEVAFNDCFFHLLTFVVPVVDVAALNWKVWAESVM